MKQLLTALFVVGVLLLAALVVFVAKVCGGHHNPLC